mgnify:CR=1 FL=1
MIIKTREQVQQEALNALIRNNGGLIAMEVGTGKSKVAVDYIKHSKAKNILITSPRTNLKDNWFKEISKWTTYIFVHSFDDSKFFEDETLHKFRVVLENIQTCYKWSDELKKFDLIILDEIHVLATPEYGKLIQLAKSLNITMVGLTGTPELYKEEKRLFYEQYCPIVYQYFRSAEDGFVNKTKYIIYEHELNNADKIWAGTKKNRFQKGELEQYEYLSKALKQAQIGMMREGSENWFEDASEWGWKGNGTKGQKFAAIKYLNAIKYRKEFLWNLTSTARIARSIADSILSNKENKVLIFSELTKQTDAISNYPVHSNISDKDNKITIDSFNQGIIRELGSVRSLQLGLNLVGANWAIFESYNGSPTGAKQSQGRLQRLDANDIAHVVIIRVVNTQYDTWFEGFTKLLKITDSNSIVVNSITQFNDIMR